MSVTPAGIEPATFRFVAQHLNHCATAVPDNSLVQYNKRKVSLAVTDQPDCLKFLYKTQLTAFRRHYDLWKQPGREEQQ